MTPTSSSTTSKSGKAYPIKVQVVQDETNNVENRSHPAINWFGLSMVFLTPAAGGFLYGFDLGATSFVLSIMLDDISKHESGVWWDDMTKMQQGLFVSAVSLGALFGSIILYVWLSSSATAQSLGRRAELRICAALYIVGTFCNVVSGTVLAPFGRLGFLTLFIGRLLFGMGVGFNMHGAPTYMAEMCPPQVRGAMVSAKETVIVGGIVIGYLAGNIVSLHDASWTTLYAISMIGSIPMAILTLYIPRSKRWLLWQGLHDEAFESMKFVYCATDKIYEHDNNNSYNTESIKSEFQELKTSIENEKNNMQQNNGANSESSIFGLAKQNPAAFIASMGLILFQQCSGQPSVISYATVLFQAAGWSGNASVVTAVLMTLTSMTTVALVDKIGRKKLLITCCIVMASALICLAIGFWGWQDNTYTTTDVMIQEPSQKNMILIAMFVYIGGYQIGFGPITWCIVSEIYPLQVRGKAIALGVEWNYLLNFLVQLTFPTIQDKLGWGATFCMFAMFLACCVVFIQRFVPETTGYTLEEIQIQLDKVMIMTSSSSSSNRMAAATTTLFVDSTNNNNANSETASLLLPPQVLGAVPSLEEMESQIIIRTHSGSHIIMNSQQYNSVAEETEQDTANVGLDL